MATVSCDEVVRRVLICRGCSAARGPEVMLAGQTARRTAERVAAAEGQEQPAVLRSCVVVGAAALWWAHVLHADGRCPEGRW